jgi:AcrR family transcriptional regulator
MGNGAANMANLLPSGLQRTEGVILSVHRSSPDEKKARPRRHYRTLSAERQRQRTRAQLLEATMRVCAEAGSEPVVIGDVLKLAGVSRATFYAHFKSLGEAMAAVEIALSEEMYIRAYPYYSGLNDPVRKVAMSVQIFLTRASLDPVWSRAFIVIGTFSPASMDALRQTLSRGKDSGVFSFRDVAAAADIQMGATTQAARTLQTLKTGHEAYIEAVAFGALRALGVSEKMADAAVRWATNDLRVKPSLWQTDSYFPDAHPDSSRSRLTGKKNARRVSAGAVRLSGQGRRRAPTDP